MAKKVRRSLACKSPVLALARTRRALTTARREAKGGAKVRTLKAALKSVDEALRVVETEFASLDDPKAYRVPLAK